MQDDVGTQSTVGCRCLPQNRAIDWPFHDSQLSATGTDDGEGLTSRSRPICWTNEDACGQEWPWWHAGEFSIVIAGLGAGLEPQLGPLSAAYMLLLAVLGPILVRASK
jgi:hypothetical protein